MSRLSACLFEWDAADLALLCEAKKQQLQSRGLSLPADGDIRKYLSREELALHCWRRTRGEETTVQLLEELLRLFMGSSGNDSLGVPLFDSERMEHIWRVQNKHVKCIQDLPGVALYTKTGELTKGGVHLPIYRCARGSTSLESFHLHLNRFIPGTSANSVNFQIYLLEGLHRWNQDRGAAALSSGPSPLRSYSGDLLHCVNKNYQKLFGRKVAPQFCPPSRYTGELIGVQYLFRQTGQALQDMHPDSEETAQLIEQHDVEDQIEEDEGFSDVSEDPTVLEVSHAQASPTQGPSTVPSGLASSVSSTAPGPSTLAHGPYTLAPSSSFSVAGVDIQAEDEDMAVDEQNIPGYQHVDSLAEYLVELRHMTSLCLSNQQADTIISLWQALDDGDKQRVVYEARHRDRLLSGRFRTPKKPSKTPGVESAIRCTLGASSASAQWPDCSRLVQNIFIRLCDLYPSPLRKGKITDSRWSLILRDYRKIRQLVVGNALVMQGTDIQLFEVNQNTLIQWHNSKSKREGLAVLLQGTALPPALPVSAHPLQEARVLLDEPMQAKEEHLYRLPTSTAGQAQQRQAAVGQRPRPILPRGPVMRQLVATFPAPGPFLGPQVVTPAGVVQLVVPTNPQPTSPATIETGATLKRPYRRTVEANTCKKCGQFRTAETGHSQWRGRVYCPVKESQPKDQWLEEMRRKFCK
ncbi:uncharacterized protein LOC130163831 [Seriola aureovittata]|uniref:uncharacterized protein LOC130163831 n=1 Tax=Seriola aureovittata TaxID=2871759 RepID=UPI0024BD6C20|nr:uncharacterized protein LOC130163831 [Seriola aureovittata]